MRSRVWPIVLLGSLSAFGPLSIDMYIPALPQLTRNLDIGASTGQLTITACLTGLALGQLVAGPVSDRFGRRGPLLLGLAAYVAGSLLCALAPSAAVLVPLRVVQGAAGGAGVVVARAIARDLHAGVALARFFSTLMLVTGVAPIFAPIVGAQLLRVTSWRGIFVVLAGIGAVLTAAATLGLRETLPPERRHRGGFVAVRATVTELVHDRGFVSYLSVFGLSFGAMFAYIAGSPFVIEVVHGASPQVFSLVFSLNGAGLVAASQANRFLLARADERRLLGVGVSVAAAGGLALLASVLAGLGLVAIVPSLFAVVASLGFVLPNATTLALTDHPRVAGSASGLIGVFQFVVGAAAAPVVGVAGTHSEYPMAIVIATLAVSALVVLRLETGPVRPVRPSPPPDGAAGREAPEWPG